MTCWAISGKRRPRYRWVFYRNLVRGMGYYTGAIFEIAHPSSSSSLGGGGRYDGMIGRFLGRDVPATGFSIGFERILELVDLRTDATEDARALVYDDTVPPARLVALKVALIAGGTRVRLERSRKNAGALFAELAAAGYGQVATVSTATTSVDDLEFRDLA